MTAKKRGVSCRVTTPFHGPFREFLNSLREKPTKTSLKTHQQQMLKQTGTWKKHLKWNQKIGNQRCEEVEQSQRFLDLPSIPVLGNSQHHLRRTTV